MRHQVIGSCLQKGGKEAGKGLVLGLQRDAKHSETGAPNGTFADASHTHEPSDVNRIQPIAQKLGFFFSRVPEGLCLIREPYPYAM